VIRHEICATEDGSPTLMTTYASGTAEKMHHFRGALSESLYIYRPAVEWGLRFKREPVRVLSLGLGLGYNEIITCATALREGAIDRIRIVSFETDLGLRSSFQSWLFGESSALNAGYNEILAQTAAAHSLQPRDLKSAMKDLRSKGRLALRGGFPQALIPHEKFSVILYDAFSRKMDEELWSESNLNDLLENYTTATCTLATYAATGALKRALKSAKFQMVPKPGYGGKRESTFAVRE
jgi:tRNA U34 5-methylaminomethyl-2-thiouridine-forming methyltransferase MnmC